MTVHIYRYIHIYIYIQYISNIPTIDPFPAADWCQTASARCSSGSAGSRGVPLPGQGGYWGTRYITGMESGYMKHKPCIYIIDCHKIIRINMYIIYIYIYYG